MGAAGDPSGAVKPRRAFSDTSPGIENSAGAVVWIAKALLAEKPKNKEIASSRPGLPASGEPGRGRLRLEFSVYRRN